MPSPADDWIHSGTGSPPRACWSHPLEGRFAHLALAWETDEALVADEAGGLYVFDRDGTLRHMTRGYADVRGLALSADGNRALVAHEENQLTLFDRGLRARWSTRFYDAVQAMALDPFGRHMALAVAARRIHVMTAADRRHVAEIETMRPIRFLRFAAARPYLVAAAEDGLLAGIKFFGNIDWEERLFTTAGDLAINGNATMILLAGFAHGLQRYNTRGNNRGSYMVDGSPARVSTSFSNGRIATATLEGDLYRMDQKGNLLWATHVPDEIIAIGLDALGEALTVGLAPGRIVRLDWREPAENDPNLP